MFETRVFELSGEHTFIDNSRIVAMFWRQMSDVFESKTVDVLTQVGGLNHRLPVKSSYLGSWGDIKEMDDVAFVSEALRTIKKHRVIDSFTYELCPDVRQDYFAPGKHTVAFDDVPVFDVTVEPNKYVFKPMTFAMHNCPEEFLSHKPNFDKALRTVKLGCSTTLDNRSRGVFSEMYRKINVEYESLHS
jgi:hypothetical protein